MFETFSYLPPLSDDQIARQVDYIVNNGWTPCLEFSEPELAYVGSQSAIRMGPVTSVSDNWLFSGVGMSF
jgi:ribulose-bisphosphate carboxylase small chain